MKSNRECIKELIDYIEDHLDETLTLEGLAHDMNYSKYHLHRMFTAIVGFPLHVYIQRRRLTIAANKLVFSEASIIDIALSAGYETQRSFTKAFRALFKCSPNTLRRHHHYLPLQLKFELSDCDKRSEPMFLGIEQCELDELLLIGYHHNTEKGFHGIGKCWHQLNKNKATIPNRKDPNYLIGVNDYTHYAVDEDSAPNFDHYAACEVTSLDQVPKGMTILTLPKSHYVVFRFNGHNEDPMDQVSDYIYKEWFPASTCQLNEKACYDFIKYSESCDDKGLNTIEYWIPILTK